MVSPVNPSNIPLAEASVSEEEETLEVAEVKETSLEAEASSLQTTAVVNPYSDPTSFAAENRALKWKIVLGDRGPELEQLVNSVRSGTEDLLYDMARTEEKQRYEVTRQRILNDYLKTRDPNAPVTEGEVQEVNALFQRTLEEQGLDSDSTIMEKLYAQKLVEQAAADIAGEELDEEIYRNAINTTVGEMLEDTSRRIAVKEVVASELEKWDTKYQNEVSNGQAFLAHVADSIIPFVTSYAMANSLEGFETPGFFLGKHMSELVEHIRAQEPEVAKTMINEIMQNMWEFSPTQAMEMAAMLGNALENDVEFSGDLRTSTDILTVTPLGAIFKGFRAGIKGLGNAVIKTPSTVGVLARKIPKTSTQAQATIKAALNAVSKAASRPTQAGNLASSAGPNAMPIYRWVADRISPGSNSAASFKNLLDNIPSVANPRALFDGNEINLSKNFQADFINSRLTEVDKVFEFLSKKINSDRIVDPVVIRAAVQAAQDSFLSMHPLLSNNILDVRVNLGSQAPVLQRAAGDPVRSVENADFIVYQIGTDRHKGFTTLANANDYARNTLGLKSNYKVIRSNNRYVIEMTQSIDETAKTVRDELANTTKPIAGHFTDYIGYFLGSNTKIGSELSKQLATSVFGESSAQKMLEELAAPVRALKSFEKDQLGAFINDLRLMLVPGTKDNFGYFPRTISEVQNLWRNRYNELPSEKLLKAYEAFRFSNDVDYFFRNLAITKEKKRAGLMNFALSTGKGSSFLPRIEGKVVDSWENNDGITSLLTIWDSDPQNIRSVNSSFLTKADAKQIHDGLQKGELKIIQLSPAGKLELRETFKDLTRTVKGSKGGKSKKVAVLPDNDPDFVIVKTEELNSAEGIGYLHIPYRGGGHLQYHTQSQFISYGKVYDVTRKDGSVQTRYTGDANLFQAHTKKQGQFVVDYLNRLRDMELSGASKAAIKATLANAPVSSKQWALIKKESKLKTPFVLRNGGERTIDASQAMMSIPNLVDVTKSRLNLYVGNLDMVNLLQREGPLSRVVVDNPSLGNPRFHTSDPRLMSPFHTLETNYNAVLKDLSNLGDIKIKAAEDFVAMFSHTFDISQGWTKEYARSNPIDALFNAPLSKSLSTKDKLAVEKFRRTMKDFFGMKPALSEKLGFDADDFKFWVVDNARETLQEGGKLLNFIEGMTTKSPVAFFKWAAFHEHLGFWRPRQLFQQASGIVNAALIDPKNMAKTFNSSLAMTPLLLRGNDQNFIKHAANLSAKSGGMSAAEFTESFELLQRAGPLEIGLSSGYREEAVAANYFSKAKRILDRWGPGTFIAGEKMLRLTAWNTAYKKFKTANPTKKITDADIRTIINDMDIMSARMSRASQAPIQKGAMGLVTQFMGYPMRMAELMLGKQLSKSEKLALGLGNAFIYGPVTVAGGLSVYIPWHEMLKEQAVASGVDIQEDYGAIMAFNGASSLFWKILTGNNYEFDRFAPSEVDILSALFDDEGKAIEKLAGAGITNFVDDMGAVGGFLGDIINDMTMTVSGDQSRLKLVAADFSHLLEQIGTYKDISRMVMMLNIQKYRTTNGTYVGDADGLDAFMINMIGATSGDLSKYYDLGKLRKAQDDLKFAARKDLLRYADLYWQAVRDDDRQASKDFHRRFTATSIAAGMTPSETLSLLTSMGSKHNDGLRKRILENDKRKAQAAINEELLKRIEEAEKHQAQAFGDNE